MDDMELVFDALGSATRRRILDIVKSEPGCSVGTVAAAFNTSRIAVMRHLRILEEADLLVSRKRGRVRHLYHNPVPIQLIYDRWTTEYSALWSGRMADLKYAVEHPETDVQHDRSADTPTPDSHQGADRGRVA